MKKYWKLTAIVAVIVISIGTFFVNSALSKEQFPEFVIQTESGDEDEIKSLVLEGSYEESSSMYYAYTNVNISAGGSTYKSHSFLDLVFGHTPTLIKELQKEYRTFMRGKTAWVNLYFEDDQFLAYADVEDGSFSSRDHKLTISVLNKEEGHTASFKLAVPGGNEIEHLFVEDVQLVQGELFIITHNVMRKNYDEKHIYTVNLANKKISSHEAIIGAPTQGQSETYFTLQLIGSNPTRANEQLIFVKTEVKVIDDMESYREEEIDQEIISYNLATKEKEVINVPDLSLNENQLSFFDGSTIYFIRSEGEKYVVIPYSLVDDQVGKPFSIPILGELNAEGQIVTVKDDKLYIVSSQMSPRFDMTGNIIVADVLKGEILFKGQIALKDSSKREGNFELYIHEMFVN
ncbi:hypothetical protein [Litchfieldia salsa]|uniref:Uncharacterized protein n=1 Tax=Litchfieldia salsa TaxID=930152 RepID=A0A1H0Q2V4_9BACI|nr:hypothetical protein [Litchfieldia salsa]SDP10959.1 hypothetical protein SAMN05216565_101547 [Litchfieldia salsa]